MNSALLSNRASVWRAAAAAEACLFQSGSSIVEGETIPDRRI